MTAQALFLVFALLTLAVSVAPQRAGTQYSMGKVVTRKATVFASPKQTSRILTHVIQNTYVPVVGEDGNYYAVLIESGTQGYILKQRIRVIGERILASANRRLGKVRTAKAMVLAVTNQESPVLARVPQNTYIDVLEETGNYYAVLMANGTRGYVLKRDILLVRYEIIRPQ